MNRWEERIANGQVKASLQQAEAFAEELTEGLDETHLPELARVRRVLAHINAYVENADGELVGRAAHDNLAGHLGQALQQLQQQVDQKAQGSPVDLANVNDMLDYALDDLAYWPPLRTTNEVRAAQKATTALEADAKRHPRRSTEEGR